MAEGDEQNGSRPRLKGREAVREAREGLEELIGKPVEGVLGMQRDGEEWTVTVQVVELERIPNSTDLLGIYEVTLDGEGEVVAYHRTRRCHRGQADEG